MSDFNAAYPGYETTARLDELRATEYSYLDEGGHVYLDYTGSGLPARSQLFGHATRLLSGVFGNPHSDNPPSSAATLLVERARAAVLRYFNASADQYAVIFTPNATGACRLVGEAYPFGRRSRLVLTADNHNSVNGIREYAARAGARVAYLGLHGRERAAQPSGPVHRPAGVRGDQLVQGVRVPDRGRLPAGQARRAGPAAAAVVRRRHHHGGERRRRLAPDAGGRGRVRRRDGQLPVDPRRHGRARLDFRRRDRPHPPAGRHADLVAARLPGPDAAQLGGADGTRLRAADRDRAGRHGRAELPRSGRAGDRRAGGLP